VYEFIYAYDNRTILWTVSDLVEFTSLPNHIEKLLKSGLQVVFGPKIELLIGPNFLKNRV